MNDPVAICEAIKSITRLVHEHLLLALASLDSFGLSCGVTCTNPLPCAREYKTEDLPCQLFETDESGHRLRSHGFYECIRRPTRSKPAVFPRLVGVVFVSICSPSAAQDGGRTRAITSAQASSVGQGDTLRHDFNPVLLSLSLLLLCSGFIWSVWILTRASHHNTFKNRNWSWLMAFAAALAWWVVSAFAEQPPNAGADDDGRLLAISFWILFFTLYASKSYRLVRQGHQLILSSLVGSILTTVLLAAYCEHLTDDRRLRGRGMQGFAVQALAVAPFSLTI